MLLKTHFVQIAGWNVRFFVLRFLLELAMEVRIPLVYLRDHTLRFRSSAHAYILKNVVLDLFLPPSRAGLISNSLTLIVLSQQ